MADLDIFTCNFMYNSQINQMVLLLICSKPRTINKMRCSLFKISFNKYLIILFLSGSKAKV